MFTIRCTRKLLAKLDRLPTWPDPLPTTTRLGNWAGNLVPWSTEVVLFVNERSLLPVFVPYDPMESLIYRLGSETASVLLRLGAPPEVLGPEVEKMNEACLALTNSRQVLGAMNGYTSMMAGYSDRSLLDISLKFADFPRAPIGMKRPGDVALELLSAGK